MEIEVSAEIWVFSEKETTPGEVDKTLIGGKGQGLVEMARLGLPVPPGIIIPTSECAKTLTDVAGPKEMLSVLAAEAAEGVTGFLKKQLGYVPLVSVRSGARVSMPGMMDTILNVGISHANMGEWSGRLGQRAALDSYRRLIQMYGVTVKGIEAKYFHSVLKYVMASKYDQPAAPKSEGQMSVTHLKKLVEQFEKVYATRAGSPFPQTLEAQLEGAIGAVFLSWNSARAKAYRKENNIPDDWYTACVVQTMVFGNMNEQSCSGVLFSRNPSTGEKKIMGEFLPNAQGEEVVSGTATPLSMDQIGEWNVAVGSPESQIKLVTHQLEAHYRDMVDIEFTVQDGKLYLLQVRSGKRSAVAAFKIAYDMVAEGMLTKAEALKRVTSTQYVTVSKPVIDPTFKTEPVATGLAGSKGIATGKAWFSSEMAQKNPGGILVSKETTPDDFPGMAASLGILTSTGGATSHAAVVARGMDRACVVGCIAMGLSAGLAQFMQSDGSSVNMVEGQVITIDGNTGRIWFGEVPMVGGKTPDHVNEMIEWGMKPGVSVKYDAVKDSIPEEGEVYISCTGLKTAFDVENFIAYLNGQRPKLRGVLSFDDNASSFDDSKFLKTLCIASFGKKVTSEQVHGLTMFNHEQVMVAGNWTVVGLEPGMSANLKCRVHKKLKTLKELMECDSYYEVHEDLKKVLETQGVDVAEFAALLQKTGKTLKPITKPVSREQMAFSVFGQ